MIRLLSISFILATLLTATAPASAPPQRVVLASEKKECIVYLTRTGSKFHRATCSSLRYSKRPVTRSEAIAAGYIACKRCGGSKCR